MPNDGCVKNDAGSNDDDNENLLSIADMLSDIEQKRGIANLIMLR